MSVTTAKRKEGGLAETIRVVIHALIIALVIRTFIFQPFNIPSGSMEETLLVGDYLFVSKYSYGYSRYSLQLPYLPAPRFFSGRVLASQPERGDVVVFRLPSEPDTDYIKRVIGLPGDRIQVKLGVLHINGVPVKQERIEDVDVEENGATLRIRKWRETLPNGVSFTTLDRMTGGLSANTPEFIVPPDRYFMMGDNRDNSQDSRFPQVGYVPFENLIGRAQIIFFSIGEGSSAWQVWRWPSAVRWSRLLTLVR